MMRTVYGMEGRNGKQCRERYYNHLKEGINKNKWTKEEENLLITLHGLYGNRWALISKQIEGRYFKKYLGPNITLKICFFLFYENQYGN
jgi:hypothetical protein